MHGRTVVAQSFVIWLLAVQLAGCSLTPALSSPEVPGLEPQVDELRAAYCADREREERQRYQQQRRAGSTLLGLGLVLGTAAISTAFAARETSDPAKEHTLHTLTATGVVGGLVSLGAGIALLATNDHEKRAARAADGAFKIVAVGDPNGPKLKKREKERYTSALFAECLGMPVPKLIASSGRAAASSDDDDVADDDEPAITLSAAKPVATPAAAAVAVAPAGAPSAAPAAAPSAAAGVVVGSPVNGKEQTKGKEKSKGTASKDGAGGK